MVMAIVLILRHEILSLSRTPGGGWAVEFQALILFASVSLALLGGGAYGITRSAAKP